MAFSFQMAYYQKVEIVKRDFGPVKDVFVFVIIYNNV